MINIELVNKSNNPLPEYTREGDSGMDVRAFMEEDSTILQPLQRQLIHTGVYVSDIPEGYEIQVRPRSGLALKNGLTVLNTPGTIDSNYRGEICVILINLSSEKQEIKNGDRIAQLVVAKVEKAQLIGTSCVNYNTERNESGFGSSGIK